MKTLKLWFAGLLLLAVASCAGARFDTAVIAKGLTNSGLFISTPSSLQTLAAGTAISANAAVVSVEAAGNTVGNKATNNTHTSVSSVSGGTAGTYPLRVARSGGSNVYFYWNGTAASGNPYMAGNWSINIFPLTITDGTAGSITLADNGGVIDNDTDVTDSVVISGPVTLTGQPTIADGTNGQQLAVRVANGSSAVTLQSGAGTYNLLLRAASVALAANDILDLVFDSSVGAWVQTNMPKSWAGDSSLALDGSWITAGTVAAARIPTLNQNTTGTAGGLTGGTSATPQFARLGLGAAADGTALLYAVGVNPLVKIDANDAVNDRTATLWLQAGNGADPSSASRLKISNSSANQTYNKLQIVNGSNSVLATIDGSGNFTANGGISGTTGTFTGLVEASKGAADTRNVLVLRNDVAATGTNALLKLERGSDGTRDLINAQINGTDYFRVDPNGYVMGLAGVMVGANSTNNLIDDASNGAGSTTLYIGNQPITTSSDRRIKTAIKPTTLNATEVLNGLKVVDFRWAKDSTQAKSYNGGKTLQGLIAQDLVTVLPQYVNTNGGAPDGPFSPGQEWKVDYPSMVPVLVKALQESDAKIAALEARLAALEKKAK